MSCCHLQHLTWEKKMTGQKLFLSTLQCRAPKILITALHLKNVSSAIIRDEMNEFRSYFPQERLLTLKKQAAQITQQAQREKESFLKERGNLDAMLQRVRVAPLPRSASSPLEASGNADVVGCPVSQEKENLSALERKYAELTGGRSFTLREVDLSGGRRGPSLPFKAPQDSLQGGDGCGPFVKRAGSLLPPPFHLARERPHWPTSAAPPGVAGATRLLLARSACALSRPSFPLLFSRRPR